MLKIFEKLTNTLPYLIVAYLVWQWAPLAWSHFKAQGHPSPSFKVQTLNGETFDSANLQKPIVLAFWATWCGPCTLELKRIQRLIDKGEIPQDSVLAITSESEIETVRASVKERGYSFPVGLDVNSEVSRRFGVSVTPTLFVLNPDHSILWVTSGLSPTLEWRLRSYLNGPQKN